MTQAHGGGGIPSRYDRGIVIMLLIGLTLLAWAYTAHQASLMREMGTAMGHDMDMPMSGPPSWSPLDALLVFVMWAVMMAAMMVPGTSPMVTAFATINRRRREREAPYVPTVLFLAGYLIVWTAFAMLATAAQWLLERIGLLSLMMRSASWYLSAALFLAAGLYQFSPLKEMCLAYCRSPDVFILSEWRDGPLGAIVMGLRHGLFCMGCCAPLMALLFAIAVMDLRWVAALTIMVTAEKLLPGARLWRFGIGFGLMAVGLAFALAGWRVQG
jgi:predicted metal-binding membrane protein